MIKITSIEIDGFITSSQSVKLDFLESNVVCIYGNNGSGKTTFLEILYAVFARDEEKLFEYNVNRIKIDFIIDEDSEGKLILIKSSVNLEIEKYQKEIVVFEKELELLHKDKYIEESKISKHLEKIKDIEDFKQIEISKQIKKDLKLKGFFVDVKKKEIEKEKIKIDYKENIISKNDLNERLKKLNEEVEEINSKAKLWIEKELKKIENSKDIKKYNYDIENEKGKINLLEEEINKIKTDIFKKNNDIENCEKEIVNLQEQIKLIDNLDSIQSISVIKKEDDKSEDKYDWKEYDFSIFSMVSSIFLGIGRGIHKKENIFPRRMLWSFFNINRELIDGSKLDNKSIDDLTDKLVDYLKNENKENEGKEYFDIEEKDREKNISLPNIEINTVEQLLIEKYKKSIIEADKKITQALSTTSMNLFSGNLSSDIDISILKEKLLINKDLILDIFNFNKQYESSFVNKVSPILNKLEDDENILNNIEDFHKIVLLNIVKKLENESKLYKQIQIFLNEYNKLLNYDKELSIDVEGVKIKPSNHPLKKLSSGERHLLTFLATILLLGDTKDFILLDEPEISLDIEWQEKLLSTISKLAPDSQIIVASHSPSIMGDYFDESVEITLCE